MNNILVIGNPTVDFVKGKYFGPGGPVTYVANSLSKLGEKKIHILTSFGEDFSIEKIQEIYDERQDPHAARFPIGLVCDARPTSYTVIPSLKDVGWLDKIEKQLDPNLK